ncbi:MAG: galactitol-1-phosphate 5-dehydrogenase [Eubacterium sp.]|nr:galactitol-1-phosphate 5-dehydrogenase [Eubacterium sp.]
MKAWVLHGINDIKLECVEEPVLEEGEVLVAVKATGICGSDIPRIYKTGAHQMPLIPGHECSGLVVETGSNVDIKWKGKRVGIFPLIPCQHCKPCQSGKYEMCRNYSYLGSRRNGGFAEYMAVPEWNLVELPDNVTYEEAAMLEPMAVAVHAMRRVNFQSTSSVVVEGLGTIGLFLTMFLLEHGIQNILVIGNKEFQKRMSFQLGISENHYCDSRTENVKDFILRHTDGYGPDVFFECVGKQETISKAIDLTAPAGEICMVGNPASDIILDQNLYWKVLRHQLRVTGTWNSSYIGNNIGEDMSDDWHYVLNRLQQKKINPSAFITHRMALEELEQGFHIMRDKTEDYVKIMFGK